MFIDAKKIDKRIFVSERDANGVRSVVTHKPEYAFYYEHPDGEHTSIYGDPLKRYSSNNFFDFRDARDEAQLEGATFESDVDVVYRLLEKIYPTDDKPPLNIQILDIEVDKDPKKGFASIDNPYAAVNAISIHNKWNDQAVTLVVPPENLTMEECRDLLDGKLFQDEDGNLTTERPEGDEFEPMLEDDGYYLVADEAQLLLLTIDLLEEADILSGWNSQFFDIPYLVHRMRIVLGGEMITKIAAERGDREHPHNPTDESQNFINRLNLFPCPPTLRLVERFGSMEKCYRLHGRVHLDYLDLYRKFTYEELHSYKLDAILQKEVGQEKVEYDGSLDQLYRLDFRRFTAYSRQDTMGLSAVDDKMKLIELANSMAHLAGVTLDQVLGTVTMIEQAILKELHKSGFICYDKEEKQKEYPIPGAFVLEPNKGEYRWIASYDFNSLYPTVIRMLNISPETIVGWVNPTETLSELNRLMHEEGLDGASAWAKFPGTLEYNRVIDQSDEMVEFVGEGTGERFELTGKDLYDAIIENNWVITAFGLVITREKQGIVAYCLEKWYEQRTVYKGKMKKAKNAAKEEKDPKKKAEYEAEADYYDMLQLVQKIFLNSAYGALLNAFCRFYDPRMGASVTMSGKICLGEMVAHARKLLSSDKFHGEEAA